MMKMHKLTKLTINPIEETKPTINLVDLVEIGSDGTSIGKSTLAYRASHLYRELGRPVTCVHIESSRRRGQDAAGDNDIFIPLEQFTTAAVRTGGLVGVLSPLFKAITEIPQTGHAVIVDWPGGTAAHRLEVLAATNFDAILARKGIRGMSIVMTSSSAEHMGQAERYLKGLEKVVPNLPRALGLSGRNGPFDWPQQSEQAEAFTRLKTVAGDIPRLTIPLVEGRALQVCSDAGLDLASVLMTPSDRLATRLGLDEFAATACVSELAVWWQSTGAELRNMLEVKHADAGVPA
jgi:hypothetical protein